MILWHRSIVSFQVGTHLLPMAYWHRNHRESSWVFFHQDREKAMKWGNSPLCGYSLYRVDSEKVKGLERHVPSTVWRTRTPVPFSILELVERDENPATLPGLLEMIEQRAQEMGTLTQAR